MDATPTIKISNKGREKLFFKGYDYHLHSRNQKGEYRWRCSMQKSLFCKIFIITVKTGDTHTIKKFPSDHNHDPQACKEEVCRINNELKQMAKTSFRASQIIREVTVNCEENCRVYLPSKGAQNSKIKRVRRGITHSDEPQNIDDINIPETIKFLDGELIVLSEKRFGGEINIIMGTNASLEALSRSQCWLVDGTFYVVPSIMRQLFSLHGQVQGQVLPLIFCLMSKKSVISYNEFFYELFRIASQRNISLNPSRIISDFEPALRRSIKEYFSETDYKGCLFHFGQIIWRKVQKEGYTRKYGQNEDFSLWVRMLKSLAFVPPEEVNEYYKELKHIAADPDERRLGNWFQRNYIGSSGNIRPKYDTKFWTIADSLRHNFPRTQNSLEAWHRRLKVVVGKKNVGIYEIIQELSKEMVVVKTNLQKINAGEQLLPRKRKNQYEKIKRIMENREQMHKIEFLKSIAYNIVLY